MKRLILLLIVGSALALTGGGFFDGNMKAAHAAPAAYVGDEGGNVIPCDWQHYGQALVTDDHLVYGQGWYICRYAGGFSWYSALHGARFYIPFYAPNAPGIAYACDLSPSCYIYAWVPAF